MKGMVRLLIGIVAAGLCWSCGIFEMDGGKNHKFDKVLVMYSVGFNDLSNSLVWDIKDLSKSDLPGKNSDKAVIVISHSTKNGYTPTKPAVIRLYKDSNGHSVMDTLTTFTSSSLLTSTEVLEYSLNYVAARYPSKHYGMIFSSHSTGWLPENYSETPSSRSAGREYEYVDNEEVTHEINIQDLAAAIPFKLDYLMFDTCLMGGVEVVYELREKCDYVGVSPTEVMSEGFPYSCLPEYLLKDGDPDLEGFIDKYYETYASQSGNYQSATFTLVDCSGLEELASICKTLFEKYRDSISVVNPESIQRYFRITNNSSSGLYPLQYKFFDLKDILVKSGMTEEDSAALQTALDHSAVHKVHTDYFFQYDYSGFKIESYSGLSMYLPDATKSELNEFYKTLAWNQATGLVQ